MGKQMVYVYVYELFSLLTVTKSLQQPKLKMFVENTV